MTSPVGLRFGAVRITDYSDERMYQQRPENAGQRHINIALTPDRMADDKDKTGGQFKLGDVSLGFSALLRGWSSRLHEGGDLPTPKEMRTVLLRVVNDLEAQLKPKPKSIWPSVKYYGQEVLNVATAGIVPRPSIWAGQPHLIEPDNEAGEELKRFQTIKPALVRAIRTNPFAHLKFVQYQKEDDGLMETWYNGRLANVGTWNPISQSWDNNNAELKGDDLARYLDQRKGYTQTAVDQTLALVDYASAEQWSFFRQAFGSNDPKQGLVNPSQDVFSEN